MKPRLPVLLVFPDDLLNTEGSDVEHYREVFRGTRQYFDVRILDFPSPNESPLRRRLEGSLPLWLMILLRAVVGHRAKLTRSLVSEKGVVYAGFLPLVAVVLLIRRVFRARYLVVCHVVGAPDTRDILGRLFHRIFTPVILKECDGVVAEEYGPMSTLARAYSKRVAITPIVTADLNRFRLNPFERRERRRLLGLEGRFVVGLVGPFVGPTALSIQFVVAHLAEFHPSVVFLAIGYADKETTYQDPRLTFIGKVRDFPDTLGVLDCLLIPRFQTIKAPMRKMVYGMAAGLPVVTNDTEGMRISNGTDAVVCKMDEMPVRVNELAENPDRAKSIGNAARAYVERHHSSATMIDREIELFTNLVRPP